jgi:tetratricopeptide (TPR) repeat protein
MRSVWALFRGEFDEAEMLVEDAQRIGSRAQTWDAGCSYRLALFALRREQGRLHEIEDIIRASVLEYPGYRVFRCLVVLLECELGREPVAQHLFAELAAEDFAALPRDGEWLFCLCTLAEVAARLHDRERATILYEQLQPYAHLNPLASGEIAAGSVARYLGMLASTTGRWEDAARLFNDALEMNERMGAWPCLAHTQEDYASMLIARNAPGDNERSRKLLELALATYKELGMHKHMASNRTLT